MLSFRARFLLAWNKWGKIFYVPITDTFENLSSLWRNNAGDTVESRWSFTRRKIYPYILYSSTIHFLCDIIDFEVIVDNLAKWDDAPKRDISKRFNIICVVFNIRQYKCFRTL